MEWVTSEKEFFRDTLSTLPPESQRKHIEVLLALSGKVREKAFYHGECRNGATGSQCGEQLDVLMVRCHKYNTNNKEEFVVLVKPCTKHLKDYVKAGWEEL